MANRPNANDKGYQVPDFTPEMIQFLNGIDVEIEDGVDFSGLNFVGLDLSLVRKVFWYRMGYFGAKEGNPQGAAPTAAQVQAWLADNQDTKTLWFHWIAWVALTRLASKVRVMGSTDPKQGVFLRLYNLMFDKRVSGDPKAVTVNRFLLAFGVKINAFWNTYRGLLPADHPLVKARVAAQMPVEFAYITGNVLWNDRYVPANEADATARKNKWVLFIKNVHTLTQRTKPWNDTLKEQVERFYDLSAPVAPV